MGLTGMVFSIIAVTTGAIMYWAVTSHAHEFRLSTIGVILMVVGTVSLVGSTIIFVTSRRMVGIRAPRIYHRGSSDLEGRTAAVHEDLR
ncbi:MAG: hypothetical protein ABSC30_06190 [Acidimicrobiales bacterium]